MLAIDSWGELFEFRFKPGRDLAAVAVTWILVTGSLWAATNVVGAENGGMTWSEMGVLFLVGAVYAAVFRITRSVFILWPVLQPLGQLFTLVEDGLDLPMIAMLGFAEALIAMGVLVWLAHRYWKKRVRVLSDDGLMAAPASM